MFGLIPGSLALTALLTAGALLLTIFRIGPGFLLYLAMLGADAMWLLPLHIAIALPAAVFGGGLVAAAGDRRSLDRPRPKDVLALTFVATIVSLYLVGWGMPAAHHATAAASARMTQRVESPRISPSGMDLYQLFADESAAGRTELFERLRLVVACAAFGLLATGFVASPLRWSPSAAFGATAVAFIWQMRYLVEKLPDS